MVEHQVIAGAVAHQNVAVAVQNVASCRLDTGLGDVNFRIVRVAVGFDDLQPEQAPAEKRQNSAEKQQQCDGTGFA